MKRLTLLIITSLIFNASFAQEKERTPIGGRPDIKGDLVIDVGFNTLNNKPDELSTTFLRSRTLNVYYQYPIRIFGNESGFTFNPGLGFGTDKMSFRNDRTLFNNPAIGPESSQLLEIESVYGSGVTVNRNTVAVNYFEVPLEFRYHFNKKNYDRSVRLALGGKIGYLMNAHTKIDITDAAGLTRRIKDRQSYGLNPLRYGVFAKLGFPGFNVWGYYGLNEVFQTGKGPFETQATQVNFGVSVALF